MRRGGWDDVSVWVLESSVGSCDCCSADRRAQGVDVQDETSSRGERLCATFLQGLVRHGIGSELMVCCSGVGDNLNYKRSS